MLPGLFFGANIALFFTAITKTSIAHAEFIGAMTPLVLLPLGALMFQEQPNWRALRWGAVSVVGVVLVLFFGAGGGSSSIGGDLLMVGVLALWAGYLLSSKRARVAGVGTIDFMSCMMPIGVLVAGPIAAIIAGADVFGLSARGWLVVAILTLLTGMLSHGCIVFAQQHIPVATIGIMQTAQPALAVLFGFLILGEVGPATTDGRHGARDQWAGAVHPVEPAGRGRRAGRGRGRRRHATAGLTPDPETSRDPDAERPNPGFRMGGVHLAFRWNSHSRARMDACASW